ncbi:hypothetical protein D0466_18935 [Peribacillus glennii]|uniref:Uncharacterized protein n=1 Tax=Peribacillus glennii TaxID=2303991 RepID=A0A372L9Q4_9BACI|nr:hypothetical protein D0466_18935 [Peribacillus glennii]
MRIKEAIELSRNYLAYPHQNESFYDILKKKKAIDLRNNFYIVDLGNGYEDVLPIDTNKKFK